MMAWGLQNHALSGAPSFLNVGGKFWGEATPAPFLCFCTEGACPGKLSLPK